MMSTQTSDHNWSEDFIFDTADLGQGFSYYNNM